MVLRKKVLEVGYGGRPVGTELKSFVKRLPQQVDYHGIDSGYMLSDGSPNLWLPYGLDLIIDELFKTERLHSVMRMDNVFLHRMDARGMLFGRDSFDETHMHWFLTDPVVRREDTVTRALKEVMRVLKPGGVVVVSGETTDNKKKEVLEALVYAGFDTIGENSASEQSLLGEFLKPKIEHAEQGEEFLFVGRK